MTVQNTILLFLHLFHFLWMTLVYFGKHITNKHITFTEGELTFALTWAVVKGKGK